MKVCFKCSTRKPLGEYYKHNGMSDGYLNKCKDCAKEDVKKRTQYLYNDIVWVQKEKERNREKYHRLNYREKHKPSPKQKKSQVKKHRSKYPEKHKARILSQRVKVSVKGHHKHHWSYNIEDAKDVIELPVLIHNKVHRFMTYDQKTFMYKDLNGNLLDLSLIHI